MEQNNLQNVITLITDPEKQNLDETIINKTFIALEKKGAKIDNLAWLSENEACDIIFTKIEPSNAYNIARGKLKELPVDIIAQTNNNRRKKMLISDMDSTIINQECIDEMADVLGLKDQVAQITERAMNGELDFKDSLRERVALLKDLPEEKLQEVYDSKITLMQGAKELVNTMRNNDSLCILVSGGFTFFTEKIAQQTGFHENRANILEIKSNKLTGKVIEPILDRNAKLDCLDEKIQELGITKNDVIAVGDGANDLPMLKGAGIGVAYHAKPAVKQETNAQIEFTSLKSLLYIQGYKKEEIVK